MSKKKRSHTQRLLEEKRRLQQQLNTSVNVAPDKLKENTEQIFAKEDAKDSQPLPSDMNKTHPIVGITRTIISTIIVIILLVGAVVVSQKSNYLNTLGNYIYGSIN